MQQTITGDISKATHCDYFGSSEQLSVPTKVARPAPQPHQLSYHLHTLVLFTYDQIFDTIIPGTVFGIVTTLSGPGLALVAEPTPTVLLRAPIIFAWLWLIILQFCLQNQCSDGSPEEDAINKPWRPIPSGRITLADAKALLMVTRLAAGSISWCLGVIYPLLFWTTLSTLYNDLGGSDRSGIVRNAFCGGFFTCSFGGALLITLNGQRVSEAAVRWTFLVCWCILMTTIQTQEFRDEIGDKQRGRRTLVTELGRVRALWTVYATVTFWSLYIPFGFFAGTWQLALLPVGFGSQLLFTAIRAMREDGRKFDRKMYKLWCLWIVAFFPLPLIKSVFG